MKKTLEEPKQYPIGGYAPGFYSCTCVNCKTKFQGDKRAVQCEPCAIKMIKEEIKPSTMKKTLQEESDNHANYNLQMKAEWYVKNQIDQMYSKEDLKNAWEDGRNGETKIIGNYPFDYNSFKNKTFIEWFNQFKKS